MRLIFWMEGIVNVDQALWLACEKAPYSFPPMVADEQIGASVRKRQADRGNDLDGVLIKEERRCPRRQRPKADIPGLAQPFEKLKRSGFTPAVRILQLAEDVDVFNALLPERGYRVSTSQYHERLSCQISVA